MPAVWAPPPLGLIVGLELAGYNNSRARGPALLSGCGRVVAAVAGIYRSSSRTTCSATLPLPEGLIAGIPGPQKTFQASILSGSIEAMPHLLRVRERVAQESGSRQNEGGRDPVIR